jgi:hypothetical protein
MNTILLKVQKYLDSISKQPAKLDEKLVEEFGEACKNALLKQFQEERNTKFELRMSNVGRPLCQLQMEAKGIKGEGQPYNNKMRNTFGDLIEALAIFRMSRKKLHTSLMETQLRVDKMLRSMRKYGILRVRHLIPLRKSLVRQEVLRKLSKMIPLVMHHRDFYMGKVRKKTLVDG